MRNIILLLSFLYANTLFGQTSCQVVVSYTPATCPTCCDGSASAYLVTGCAVTYSWSPTGGTSSMAVGLCPATYSVYAYDGGGGSCCGLVTGTVTITSSTSGIKNNNNSVYSVFPNPSNGEFFISFENANTLTVELYDLMGRPLLKQNINSENGIGRVKTELQDGAYILKQINSINGEQIIRQIIVNH